MLHISSPKLTSVASEVPRGDHPYWKQAWLTALGFDRDPGTRVAFV